MRRLFGRVSKASEGSSAFNDKPLVFSTGPVPSALMIVGEAPGRNEVAEGKPFVGKAGAFLVAILEEVFGCGRESIYITNVVKLWPHLKTKRLKTRPPTPEERALFIPYLLEEIELVDPLVIIAVGKTAFSAVAPDRVFTPGLWVKGVCGRDIMPVYHPAYILRRQRSLDDMTRDLKAALGKAGKRVAPLGPHGRRQA